METGSFGERVRRTTRKVVRVIIIVILAGAAISFAFFYWGVYDDGFISGRIIRVSKKGVIFKTYEGKINLETFGALRGTSPIAESFDFSIEKGDDELIKQLQEAALKGELINLHFVKRYAVFPWRGDTRYFAVKVERAAGGTPATPNPPPTDRGQ